jgi:DNA-binding response OmpR family regulator
MKILLMDDSGEPSQAIGKYLPDCVIEVVTEFEKLTQRLHSDHFDCIIMDLSACRQRPAQAIKELKRISTKAGIIILSGNASLSDRIDALKAGADDFLMRPFDLSELSARILSLLRRLIVLNIEHRSYREIEMDMNAKMVYVNNSRIDLTKKELELLLYFIENKNRVITRESLSAHLANQRKEPRHNADIIYAHVKNLKKKLAGADCNPYLKTVYGIGYKWEDL